MRHRASSNLIALLRLRPRRPRRRAPAPPARRHGLWLACAVAAVLASLTGGLVAASQYGDDTTTTAGPERAADRGTRVLRASRSDVRAPFPTASAAQRQTSASPSSTDGGPAAPSRGAGPTTDSAPKAPHSSEPQSSGLLPTGLADALTPDVTATRAPLPRVTSASTPAPEESASEQPTGQPSEPQGEETSSPAPPPTSSTPTGDESTRAADTTPPQTTIESGPIVADDSGYGEDSEFSFEANEPATFTCSLDGGAFRPCDSPQEYDGLRPGRHEFAVRAVDQAGNTDPSPDTKAWISAGLDKEPEHELPDDPSNELRDDAPDDPLD